jgi:TnpA family transposase
MEVYEKPAGKSRWLLGLFALRELLHTSSDGQKYGVAVESLNATYSFKYFGKDAGVSPYTFIDERHFLWHHEVISASEREAAYVIDGLMHNDVIKSDIHSTDTHGYSEIIFGALHLLGFSFAPRIKTLTHQQLYGFRKRREYEQQGYQLLPDGYIKESLIETQWDEMLRFIATIKLKETTASQLFRRLNSYARQHPLYQALKESANPQIDFILRVIDDVELRRRKTPQQGSANKFSKAISFGTTMTSYGEKINKRGGDAAADQKAISAGTTCISPEDRPGREPRAARNCSRPSKRLGGELASRQFAANMILRRKIDSVGFTFPGARLKRVLTAGSEGFYRALPL